MPGFTILEKTFGGIVETGSRITSWFSPVSSWFKQAPPPNHAVPPGGPTAPQSKAPDLDNVKTLGVNALAAVFGFSFVDLVRAATGDGGADWVCRGGTPSEAVFSRGRGGFGPRPFAFRQGRLLGRAAVLNSGTDVRAGSSRGVSPRPDAE